MLFRTDGLFAVFHHTVSPVRKISYEPPAVKSSLKYRISQRIQKMHIGRKNGYRFLQPVFESSVLCGKRKEVKL